MNAEVKRLRNDVVGRVLRTKYPAVASALETANDKYIEGLKYAIELQDDGKMLIVAPDDILGMKTLTKDVQKLNALYEKGYADAAAIKTFITD